MEELFNVSNLIALLSLASLEIVLGIDNIIILAILTDKIEKEKQNFVRRLGLFLAMFMRIALLVSISWLANLTEPIMSFLEYDFSGRDLILLSGGFFLIIKATMEMHSTIEGGDGNDATKKRKPKSKTYSVILQIILLDLVFSLDSVITAVGMVNNIPIMIMAIIVAVIVMMFFAAPVGTFILKNPTLKVLALAFLLMVGIVLVADGFGHHIEKGYLYFAMAFSFVVEMLNFRVRKKLV